MKTEERRAVVLVQCPASLGPAVGKLSDGCFLSRNCWQLTSKSYMSNLLRYPIFCEVQTHPTCEAFDGVRVGSPLLTSPIWSLISVSILETTWLLPGLVVFVMVVYLFIFFEVGFSIDPDGIRLAM